MNIKVNEKREDNVGIMSSLFDCVGLLTAYVMVFYFLWKGLLLAACAN